MTILRFPQRLTDDLRLAIHAAWEEGDVLIAERLSTVLRRYVPGSSYLPGGGDQILAGLCERLTDNPRAGPDEVPG